ncbi:hypothetical protein G114_06807 [Aeromonas diversa CDC 2478-85]|uniref:Zinc-binding protein n=1 Tax=Aeromonas diversa CDC 2478-85 TaxID=1268237 RepID=N9U2N0_9GAMM|nr:DUF2796 domain-containing protein [Aeromonas diversa]ENY72629.1 hypothetical protein G114_06807 [Aeromonas diversa CDC 2478-85]
MKTIALMMAAAAFSASAHHDDHASAGHGAHEHGHGQLNLVQDGNQLMLELTTPAADLIGFEHAPKTDDEKARMAQALARLKAAEGLFIPTPAAGCTLTEQVIQGGQEEDEHDHDHDHHDANDHDHHEGHADLGATYTFTCQQPTELKGLEAGLFTFYPSLEKLTVQGLIPGGQVAGELTPDNKTLGW